MTVENTLLDVATRLVASLALAVTHVHGDAAFVEHNLFAFVAPEPEKAVWLAFNRDCPPDIAARTALAIFDQAADLDLSIGLIGTYHLEQRDNGLMDFILHPENEIGGHEHPEQ